MMIPATTTRVKTRQLRAECFVVDYDRLLPNTWPSLTPVADYQPMLTDRRRYNRVDRIPVLRLLKAGLTPPQVAKQLGCSADWVRGIRRAAAEAMAAQLST